MSPRATATAMDPAGGKAASGSGLNLFVEEAVIEGQVRRVVVLHRDRVGRFLLPTLFSQSPRYKLGKA